MLTGDSLFVGDAARPDLAVEPRAGRGGPLPPACSGCSSCRDGVEVYPGHVAGSLCGAADELEGLDARSASSAASTRCSRLDDASRSSSPSRPARPGCGRRTSSGSSRSTAGRSSARPAPLEPRRRSRTARPCSTCATARAFAAGHVPGALNVPVGRVGVRDQGAASCSRRTSASSCTPTRPREADTRGAPAACGRLPRPRGLARRAGRRRAQARAGQARRARAPARRRTRCRSLDVREADERDDGYIPGSRHVPYRLVRRVRRRRRRRHARRDDLRVRRACRGSPRASSRRTASTRGRCSTAACDGWNDRGHETIEFRRCGS